MPEKKVYCNVSFCFNNSLFVKKAWNLLSKFFTGQKILEDLESQNTNAIKKNDEIYLRDVNMATTIGKCDVYVIKTIRGNDVEAIEGKN